MFLFLAFGNIALVLGVSLIAIGLSGIFLFSDYDSFYEGLEEKDTECAKDDRNPDSRIIKLNSQSIRRGPYHQNRIGTLSNSIFMRSKILDSIWCIGIQIQPSQAFVEKQNCPTGFVDSFTLRNQAFIGRITDSRISEGYATIGLG